jgi:glycosyltransferase involved in cell wall biosynthesis
MLNSSRLKQLVFASPRWLIRSCRGSPLAVKTVGRIRRSALGKAGWRVARRSALVRQLVERLRDGPDFSTADAHPSPNGHNGAAAFFTPPVGLLPWFNPLNIRVVEAMADRPSLNVLLPSLAMRQLSGGPNTALNLACRLAAMGIRVRLISVDAAPDDRDRLWAHLRGLTGIEDLSNVALVDASDRGEMLDIGENDVFLATAWWTAQMVKYAIRHTRNTRFVYLIQDYEPLLHPASTPWALAEETYRLDYVPVINSSLLAGYFHGQGIGRFADPAFHARALVFEPALDRTLFYAEPRRPPAAGKTPPRRTLLFYARPLKGLRNLFELGVAALRKLVEDGLLDPRRWRIVGIGEQFDPISLGRGVMLRAEPWRDLESYARLMRESDVLLSLMMSPHPSYPPLEMAACGRPVVTSVYANKTAERLAAISDGIIAVEPTIDAIAGGLTRAIATAEAACPVRQQPGHIALPTSWDESLAPVLPALYRAVVGILEGPRAPPGPADTEPALFEGYQRWPSNPYEVRRLDAWRARRHRYRDPRPGLISFLTTVWNTDPAWLQALADTVFQQDSGPGFEWILLDNGSTNPATVALLKQLATRPGVRFFRVEQNAGILGGMRRCLDLAGNRYIVPLDSDDLLTPDCVRVLTSALAEAGYPALAYTDEDKLDQTGYRDAYVKPDFDPVLFAHSCFIAHLCAIDRELALELGVYSDPVPEGSHDWDSFTRFLSHGHTPFHVPEILYTWRMHAQSTAGNIDCKNFIFGSQRHVVETFARGTNSGDYRVELSPLFGGAPDWRILPREPVDASAFATIDLTDAMTVENLETRLAAIDPSIALIHLRHADGTIVRDDWPAEALTLMALFPDTDIVGGRVHDGSFIREAGYVFGYGGVIGCPDIGRALSDPGYFAQMWKPRGVAAVSARHCVARRDRLAKVLKSLPPDFGVAALGAFLGGATRAAGRRVIYTPFFEFATTVDIPRNFDAAVLELFTARFGFLSGDPVGYPAALDRGGHAPYRIGTGPKTPDHRPAYQTWQAWSEPARDQPIAADGPGFSILTTCYINTDAALLREAAASVLRQTWRTFEWIVLAHGPVSAAVSTLLDELGESDRVVVLRKDVNLGIRGGLAHCLDRATGEFVLALDADDLLTQDALASLASAIAHAPATEILYSDEDLLIEGSPRHPWYRPDFDPVLAMTHSYVWHLIAFRRATALTLGVYSGTGAEYAQDWDTMLRFRRAGHAPVHVAKVLYHWRQHGRSLSHSGKAFEGSRASVESILRDVAAASGHPERYQVIEDPFFPGGSDCCLRRLPVDAPSGRILLAGDRDEPPVRRIGGNACGPMFATETIPLDGSIAPLAAALERTTESLVLLLGPGVTLDGWDGVWDAIRHLELVPEAMAVGGPLILHRNDIQVVQEMNGRAACAGKVLFGAPVTLPCGILVDPLAGSPDLDPGPFSLALKPHCVSVLAVDLMLARTGFLRRVVASMSPDQPARTLGVEAGKQAEAAGERLVFAPALRGLVADPDQLLAATIGNRGIPARWTSAPPIRGLASFAWHGFLHR